MRIQASGTSPKSGYLYVITAALLWGISGPAAKFIFQTGVSPFELVQLRLTIAAGFLLAWLLLAPFSAFSSRYTLVQWSWIGYVSLLGTLLPFGFYLKGISRIRSTRASITAMLEPIAAGVLSFVFLNEMMTRLQIAGAVMVMAAVALLQLRQELDESAPAVIRARTGDKER